MHWFIDPIKNKYADFSGRATRQEFWMFTLIYTIIYILLLFISDVIAILFTLAILAPGVAITARRLHDTNKTGWLQLIGLIPVVGIIIMIVFLVRDGDAESNQYGANPKMSGGGDAGVTPDSGMADTPATNPAGEAGEAVEPETPASVPEEGKV